MGSGEIINGTMCPPSKESTANNLFSTFSFHSKEAEQPIVTVVARNDRLLPKSVLEALLLTIPTSATQTLTTTAAIRLRDTTYLAYARISWRRSACNREGDTASAKLMVSWMNMYPRGMCYEVVHH